MWTINKSFFKAIFTIYSLCLSFTLMAQNVNSDLTFQTLFNAETEGNISCYRIPALTTAMNGDLIAAIDERGPSCGDLKLNKDINIVIKRSFDNGKTWTEAERIVDYPLGESASDPSFIVDESTGKIFLFFNYMNLMEEKDIYYLKYVSSDDNGKSWSAPVDITEQITKPSWQKDFKFITSGRGVQTEDGELVHTLVNLEKGLHLFKSSDHGESWQLIESPIEPADESKIVQLENGNWMVNSRVRQGELRFTHVSEDKGKTWTTQAEPQLADPACNASIIKIHAPIYSESKSILLFSNANSPDQRENMTVKYSLDDGVTWSKGKTIYSGSAAYSSMTYMQNGEIGLFFEKDNYLKNVFVRFSLDWLLNSE